MKKWIGLLLVVALVACMCVVPASAESVYTGYGDTDNNKKVEASDALNILKYVVGKQEMPLAQDCFWDVNADYAVTASDALEVLKFVVGKIPLFKAEENYIWFHIKGYTALNMSEGEQYDLRFTVEYDASDYNVAYTTAPEYHGLLNCLWGPWSGNDITLTVQAAQVDEITVIPLYIYIVQQPSSYFICNVTIYPR